MSTRGLNRRILDLALPNIVSNISIPLLGIVDMALMGHLGSDSYIGAIALGSLIFNFIYWGLGFLRMGTSGFTAQAWGRQDKAEAIHILSRALFIGSVLSIILLLLQYPLEKLSFLLLRGEQEVESLAIAYFRIRIWAAPAALGQFALLGWFLGMQNARLPMMVLVATNIINIACNYIFVMLLDMHSNGVALGTVIAQYSGLLLAIYLLRRNFRHYFNYWSKEAMLKMGKLKEFMSLNKDIFIRTMCLVLVFSFFTARSASSDLLSDGEETILAVNSLLMQYFMFFSFLIDGFAHAAEALTGRFVGENNRQSLSQSTRMLFIWGTFIGLTFTIIYLTGREVILKVLTNNPEIIDNARQYFPWVISIPLISFSAFLWDGIYIGATAGKEMRNSMLISTVLVFFPAYLLGSNIMGNHGLWFAFILFMISRGLTMTVLAPRALYSRLKGPKEQTMAQ